MKYNTVSYFLCVKCLIRRPSWCVLKTGCYCA